MFDAVINDFKRLKEQLPQYINSAIMEKEQEVLDINRDQLYDLGIDSQGNQIWPEYRQLTVDYKIIRNKMPGHIYEPLDHVALFQYGGFYKNMFIQQRSDHVVIWSKDPKTGKLIQKYGREIFGIADENWERFLTLVVPVIERYLDLRLKAYK